MKTLKNINIGDPIYIVPNWARDITLCINALPLFVIETRLTSNTLGKLQMKDKDGETFTILRSGLEGEVDENTTMIEYGTLNYFFNKVDAVKDLNDALQTYKQIFERLVDNAQFALNKLN